MWRSLSKIAGPSNRRAQPGSKSSTMRTALLLFSLVAAGLHGRDQRALRRRRAGQLRVARQHSRWRWADDRTRRSTHGRSTKPSFHSQLTLNEYNKTVSDLLFLKAPETTRVPPDVLTKGFTTNVASAFVSETHLDAYVAVGMTSRFPSYRLPWRHIKPIASSWTAFRCTRSTIIRVGRSSSSTPDPAGGSLLDSTIVMHGSELGDSGPHKTDRIPYVLPAVARSDSSWVKPSIFPARCPRPVGSTRAFGILRTRRCSRSSQRRWGCRCSLRSLATAGRKRWRRKRSGWSDQVAQSSAYDPSERRRHALDPAPSESYS